MAYHFADYQGSDQRCPLQRSKNCILKSIAAWRVRAGPVSTESEENHGDESVPSGVGRRDQAAPFGGASVERGLALGQAPPAAARPMGPAALPLRQPHLALTLPP